MKYLYGVGSYFQHRPGNLECYPIDMYCKSGACNGSKDDLPVFPYPIHAHLFNNPMLNPVIPVTPRQEPKNIYDLLHCVLLEMSQEPKVNRGYS